MTEARRDPFFRSHPLSNSRIAALERRANASPYRDKVDPPEDLQSFALMHAKLKGFLEPPQRTLMTFKDDNSIPGRYARAIAQYRTPDMTAALSSIRGLIADQPNNPFFYELEGQMLYENGRIKESLEPYRKSHQLAPREPLIAVSFARALAESGDLASMNEAVPILRVALVEEPDNAFAWRTLSMIHDRKGQKGAARLAAAEEAFWLGDSLRAQQFGQVARDLLPVGSPERRRAEDIVLVTEVAAIRQQRRSGGPRFSVNGVSLSEAATAH
jgi:predicted Zn-dependent protease